MFSSHVFTPYVNGLIEKGPVISQYTLAKCSSDFPRHPGISLKHPSRLQVLFDKVPFTTSIFTSFNIANMECQLYTYSGSTNHCEF